MARQHYLQITDDDFKKAASGAEAGQNPVQSGEALGGQEGTEETATLTKDVIFPSSLQMSSKVENYARQESTEPTFSAEKTQNPHGDDVNSDAVFDSHPSPAVTLLLKLMTGLTLEERATLSDLLKATEKK